MSTLNQISVVLTGNASQLSSVLGRSAAEVETFGKSAQKSGAVGKIAMAGIAASAGIAAIGLAYAVTQATQFNAAMHNVATIDSTVRTGFAKTSAQVLELSKQLPQSAKELAEGLYDVSSSGFQGAQSITVLTASAKAASAGLTTTASSAKAITAVLNAYGLGADQATRVSDALFQTVNYGVVNFEELTGVIADTVGSASAAGIPIEQLGAAVATLTLTGLSASEAGTSLNRVITSLIKPNTQLIGVQKQLGVSFTDELANPAIGLQGVLKQLLGTVGGNRTELSKLFTDIRASRGVLALTANDGKSYARVLQEMGSAGENAGATQRALAEQSKGASFQFTLLKNDFNAAAITLGTKVLPVLVDLTTWAGKAGHEVGDVLAVAAKQLAPLWGDLVGIGTNLTGVFSGLYQIAGPLAKVLVGAAFEGAAAGLLGLGIAAKESTGFLADHRTVVLGLAIAYALLNFNTIAGGFAAVAGAARAAGTSLLAFGSFSYVRIVQGIASLGGATLGTTAAMRELAVIESEAAATAAGLAAATAEAAAAQSAFNVTITGALVATGEAEAELAAYALEMRAAAVAAEELAVANRQAAASTVSVRSGLLAGGALASVATAGVVALAIGFNGMANAAGDARAHIKSLEADLDLTKLSDVSTAIEKILADFDSHKGGEAFSFGDPTQQIAKDAQEYQRLIAVREKLAAQDKLEKSNIQTLSTEYGISATQVKALAAAHKVDLSKPLETTTKDVKGQTVTVKGLIDQYQGFIGVLGQTARVANPYKASLDDLGKANKLWSDDLNENAKSFKVNIDLLKQYQAQTDVTAGSIATNLQNNLALLAGQTKDIQTLANNGASADLITKLANEGPEYIHAAAGLSKQALKQASDDIHNAQIQLAQQNSLITQVAKPADYQAQLDAKQKSDYIFYVQSVQDATTQALGIISSYTNIAAPATVQQGLAAQRKKVLDAYLATLSDPVRTAVQQALGTAATGSATVAQSVVDAILKAKPQAIFQASDLYQKVQTQLDKLHGKDLQVVLDDLASGNIAKLITDLQGLGLTIQSLPSGVLAANMPTGTLPTPYAPGTHTNALGVPVLATGGQAGRVPGFDPLGRDKAGLFALTAGEWVHNANVSAFYGDDKMQAVNQGRAQIIVPGRAAGGPIGAVDDYRLALSSGPLGTSLGGFTSRVEALTAQLKNSAAQVTAVSGSAGGAARWAPLVLQALQMEGLPASLLSRVLAQMNLESGGNPTAINLTDSNAQKGTPSKGLLQTIDATFAAYHWPGTSSNVYDPLANIAAAINYGAHRYGPETLGMGFGHGYAAGGKVGGLATGGPVNPQVAAYLASLARQKQSNGAVLKFLASATQLEPGAHSLAVRGLQDVYNMPARNSTWDTALTDFITVHNPRIGTRSDPVKYLQLALHRPSTGVFTAADRHVLTQKFAQIYPDGNFYGNILGQDKNTSDFQTYLRKIVARGFAPLASAIQDKGVEDGLDAARQMASAPTAVLQKAQAAAVRLAASSKYGDALTLASQLAQYGGKVGLLGLASRSGTSVPDVLGLVTQFPDVFKAMGSTARLLEQDLTRINAGKQPIAAYAQGAYEIKQDHIAMVHKGEMIAPTSYAEPWRRSQAAGGTAGGTTVAVSFAAGSISVGEGVSMAQVAQAVELGVNRSADQVVRAVKRGTGRRN